MLILSIKKVAYGYNCNLCAYHSSTLRSQHSCLFHGRWELESSELHFFELHELMNELNEWLKNERFEWTTFFFKLEIDAGIDSRRNLLPIDLILSCQDTFCTISLGLWYTASFSGHSWCDTLAVHHVKMNSHWVDQSLWGAPCIIL